MATPGVPAHDRIGVACTTTLPAAPGLTAAEIARLYRDLMRDKSYEQLPMGAIVAQYLRHKSRRLADASKRSYESSLDKFARFFCDVEDLAAFEPPLGTVRLEEYLDVHWGYAAPGTYNVNLAILSDFFKWCHASALLAGNPTLAIERATKATQHRETFSADQRRTLLASNPGLRDRIALRLLLDYALRKGALQRVRFQHFDHERRRLTIFTKGGRVRELPLPDPLIWRELEGHLLDIAAEPEHYLMASSKVVPRVGRIFYPDRPMSASGGMHRWWYGCLGRAGLVEPGQTSGERMHKTRHTAGQRMLDHTGNLKAVQKLLGHESIRTTADTYLDWDIEQLTASLESLIDHDRNDPTDA